MPEIATATPADLNPCSVPPDVQLGFWKKNGAGNDFLQISTPTTFIPDELLEKLDEAGWTETDRFHLSSGTTQIMVEGPKGSMLFGLWTDDERAAQCAAATAVLARFSISDVPFRTLGGGCL